MKSKQTTSVHVKAEPNAFDATIDLVTSSDENVPDNESGTDTSQKRTMVAPAALHDKERREARLEDKSMHARHKGARSSLRTPSFTSASEIGQMV